MNRRILLGAAALAVSMLRPGFAEQAVAPAEIRIGQTVAYSGPLSAFGTTGRAMAAFFDKINADGGINGRLLRFTSLDDAFSPPKTVEQTRRLVESDEVLLIAGSLGTPTGIAAQKYLNGRGVPQLLQQSGSSSFDDPQKFPWSTAALLGNVAEARAFARYILRTAPGARVGVLQQNDDFGRDYQKGLRSIFTGANEGMIADVQTFEVTEPTVDSQVLKLKASGADTLILAASGRAAAQTIRKLSELGWRPTVLLPYVSNSISAVLKPAGLDAATGVISTELLKDPGDPAWKDDPQVSEYRAWMARYYPSGNADEKLNASGYTTAQILVDILRRCGDDLSRENIRKQAVSIKSKPLPMLLPGITVSTSETDRNLFKQLQFRRFDGANWVPIGGIIGTD